MKKTTLILGVFLFVLQAFAVMHKGENIILNGKFETNQSTFPTHWIDGSVMSGITKVLPNAGPNGKPAIVIKNDGPKREIGFRQFGLNLKEGEKYRISVWVRTKDLKYSRIGISVAGYSWQTETGIRSVPENTDWVQLKKDVDMVSSADGTYFLVIYALNYTGEIALADLKLEAISDGALKYTEPSDSDSRSLRIVPWVPLLNKIPASKPEISFNVFGRVPSDKYSDYRLVVTPDDTGRPIVAKLKKGVNTVKLPKEAKQGHLEVAIVDKKTNEKCAENKFRYTVVDVPKVSAANYKVLNTLVAEILNGKVNGAQDANSFTFDTIRDGWIYIDASAFAGSAFSVDFDSESNVITNDTLGQEAFRQVGIGKHKLTVKNAGKDGNIIVRSIPEVLDYCPANSFIPVNPPYDWEFQKKYALPAITTYNGGFLTDEQVDYIKSRGQRWMSSFSCKPFSTEENFAGIIDKAKGFKDPLFCGATCDELFFGQNHVLGKVANVLRNYEFPKDRSIYTWAVGKPSIVGFDDEFIASCINASDGKGKILSELYCVTMPDIVSARKYINDFILGTMKQYNKHSPIAAENIGLILGNFNQVPVINQIHHPEVDYKYYLDMQFNLIANNPEFMNLGCIGYWGSYYGDHELHRWSMMLLRHYCIEGHRDMLSDKYGFSYMPNHVINGDFRKTVAPWTPQGNVSVSNKPGFGVSSEKRWQCMDGTGDDFVVLSKSQNEVSSVTQKATGLVPGKAYCLQFACFDTADFDVTPIKSRKLGINVSVSNVTVKDDQSWCYVNVRYDGQAKMTAFAPINMHHVVFIADSTEAVITIDNANALPGEKLGINMLSLNPFLLEE